MEDEIFIVGVLGAALVVSGIANAYLFLHRRRCQVDRALLAQVIVELIQSSYPPHGGAELGQEDDDVRKH